MKLEVTHELRPCKVNDLNALFHMWYVQKDVIGASALVGGHPGGEVTLLRGLVELKGGEMILVRPEQIIFIDNKHDEIAFE